MPTNNTVYPPYFAVVDRTRQEWFVLATPNVSALKKNGAWEYCEPLSESELERFELVTDIALIYSLVQEAKSALDL